MQSHSVVMLGWRKINKVDIIYNDHHTVARPQCNIALITARMRGFRCLCQVSCLMHVHAQGVFNVLRPTPYC